MRGKLNFFKFYPFFRPSIMNKKETILLRTITLVAALATIWSLYYWWYGDPFENMRTWQRFNPLNAIPACTICWYIRIFQYPIVLLSALGLLYNDRFVAPRYILPLAVWWFLLSLYKYALESWWVQESWTCSPSWVWCSTTYIEYLWFLTMPLMAMSVFVVIMICCLHFYKK